MLEKLTACGFEVDFRSHAKAIVGGDFPEVATQIEECTQGKGMEKAQLRGSKNY